MRIARATNGWKVLRRPTAADPLRLLVSGCIAGLPCGVDGTHYGMGGSLRELLTLPTVRVVPFCPEAHALGVPRAMPDIRGGDGFDVLDGNARVLDPHGADLTSAMVEGAQAMLALARAERAELAVLTDTSAACGTQVISDGCRFDEPRRYRAGVGVAAALLLRAGIPVVSQRDHRTLGFVRALLDPSFAPDPEAIDHHDTAWYRGYFGRSS
jgi:uncharacterized protein YbbK (DUF523 family)